MIHYQIYNQNKPHWVTFVHGAGGSSAIWYKQKAFFLKYFNVLLIDLRGHGQSAGIQNTSPYTFNNISRDLIDILDKEEISKSHFIGISMGSMIIRNLVTTHPERVHKVVLGGMVVRLNNLAMVLLYITRLTKQILPIMLMYKTLAKIILPKKSHNSSKNRFIKEAKKLSKTEFLRWFSMTKELPSIFASFKKISAIQILYIQGSEDHLFLNDVKSFVENKKNETLIIIPNCGHLINLQKPNTFNKIAADFLTLQQS